MREAHTVEQVRAAEADLMARLPEGALMRRAAAGLAAAIVDLLGGAYGRRVVLLVGSGDNGGDALYAGAMLARRGASVEAVLLGSRTHESALAALLSAGGRVATRPSAGPDVVVDAIAGIGGRPGLRENALAALRSVAGAPVVAVDVPSGGGGETRSAPGGHTHTKPTLPLR
ncbi:MAG: NAD(P)H-hydrate epimerase, partial [Nocardioides sp.]